MNTEEKAKAYDKAIEKARKELQTCGSNDCDVARQIFRFFPELKESEDEKIRKAIMEFFELQDDNTTYSFIPKKDILAWLEKQGEQKPTWSKEDEKISQWIISDIEKLFSLDKKSSIISNIEITWIKSLKERIGG